MRIALRVLGEGAVLASCFIACEPFGAADARDAGSTEPREDAGLRPSEDGDGAPPQAGRPTRYVFLTSDTYDGAMTVRGLSLKGRAAADQLCVKAAERNPNLFGRSWVAWLALKDDPAARRITGEPLSDEYRLPDGTLAFAAGTSFMTSGIPNLLQPINVDEMGRPIASTTIEAWTGPWTGELSPTPQTCSEWESNNGDRLGKVGDALDVKLWTSDRSIPCSEQRHLYCFEVKR